MCSDNELLFINEVDPLMSESMNQIPVSNTIRKEDYNEQYTPPSYITNYMSSVKLEYLSKSISAVQSLNEKKLKLYYQNKPYQQNQSTIQSSRNSTELILNKEKYTNGIPHDLPKAIRLKKNHVSRFSLEDLNPSHESERESCERHIFKTLNGDTRSIASESTQAYLLYHDRLLGLDSIQNTRLFRHNIWIPVMRWTLDNDQTVPNNESERYNLKYGDLDVNENLDFLGFSDINSSSHTDKTFGGTAVTPPIFGYEKLPALIYNCTVELNSFVYIYGGLVPCYSFSDVAPNLEDFHVDGVRNLPPPLDVNLVNNPSMIPNSHLYVFSTSSLNVKKPKIHGQIPPPLICVTVSQLTDRHLFYYGGFEIKTESFVDSSTGQYYIKRRAILNNTAYILDTVTFKFTKVKLIVQPTKFASYSKFGPRFGHVQVSIKLNLSNNKGIDLEESKSFISLDKYSSFSVLDDSKSSSPSSASSSDNHTIHKHHNSTLAGVYTILIMGGYKQNDDFSFEADHDLWKVEIAIVSRGKRNYVKFSDTALATMVPLYTDNNQRKIWPQKRAFMAASICDTSLLKKKLFEEDLLKDLKESCNIIDNTMNRLNETKPIFPNIPHSRKPQVSRLDLGTLFPKTPKDSKIGKTLIFHGGSNQNCVYGDMWWFDLDDESWTEVPLYAESSTSKKTIVVELSITGHELLLFGRMALIVGGLNQKDVNDLYGGSHVHQGRSGIECNVQTAIKTIDLCSQTFQDFSFDEKNSQPVEETRSPWLSRVRFLCGSCIKALDYTWIFGGCMILKDAHTSKSLLRGTMTILVIPLIKKMHIWRKAIK